MKREPQDVLRAWCARDHARALVPADHAAVDATEAARSLLVEGVLAGRASLPEKDLLHASGVLGRLLAESGATPTLAGGTIDALQGELPELSEPGVSDAGGEAPRGANQASGASGGAQRIRGANWGIVRAAVAEGYAAARDEAAQAAACAAWDYPRSVVRLDATTVAVAAGYPDDDGEAAAAWAARVAGALHKTGVRRAVVEGRDPAKRELAGALDLVGIEVVGGGALVRDGATRPRFSLASWLKSRLL